MPTMPGTVKPAARRRPSRHSLSLTAKQGARDLARLARTRARPSARPARFEFDDDDDDGDGDGEGSDRFSGHGKEDAVVEEDAHPLFTPDEVQQAQRRVQRGSIPFQPSPHDPFWDEVDPYSVTNLQ